MHVERGQETALALARIADLNQNHYFFNQFAFLEWKGELRYVHAFTVLSLSSMRLKRAHAYSSTVRALLLIRSRAWVAVKEYNFVATCILDVTRLSEGSES